MPPDAAIDSNGLFTCTLSQDDPFAVYNFDVEATDSAGQYDLLHVTVNASFPYLGTPAVAPDYPGRLSCSTTPWTVAVDSTDNLLFPFTTLGGAYTDLQGLNGVLEVISPPTHGAYAIVPPDQDIGYSISYTPRPGFRGIDDFTYRWTYDAYDGYGHSLGRKYTNTATYTIQVGNWVDLLPASHYQNDVHSGVLAVGASETATLVLQNPHGDGVPVTGCWTLNFDRSLIRVYDADGDEILSGGCLWWNQAGRTHLESVRGSEKQIVLTVVGVAEGSAYVVAHWTTWAGDHDTTAPSQRPPGIGIRPKSSRSP